MKSETQVSQRAESLEFQAMKFRFFFLKKTFFEF